MGRKYKSVDAGLNTIGKSPQLGRVAQSAAQDLAAAANQADPSGRYEVAPKTVLAGWKNERRAGAVVREGTPSWRGRRERTLVRVAGLMKVRGS